MCTDHILKSRACGICVDSLKTFDGLTSSFFQYEKKDSELRFNLEVLSPGSLGSPGWDDYVLSLWSEWSVSAPGSHWYHQCPVQTQVTMIDGAGNSFSSCLLSAPWRNSTSDQTPLRVEHSDQPARALRWVAVVSAATAEWISSSQRPQHNP